MYVLCGVCVLWPCLIVVSVSLAKLRLHRQTMHKCRKHWMSSQRLLQSMRLKPRSASRHRTHTLLSYLDRCGSLYSTAILQLNIVLRNSHSIVVRTSISMSITCIRTYNHSSNGDCEAPTCAAICRACVRHPASRRLPRSSNPSSQLCQMDCSRMSS